MAQDVILMTSWCIAVPCPILRSRLPSLRLTSSFNEAAQRSEIAEGSGSSDGQYFRIGRNYCIL